MSEYKKGSISLIGAISQGTGVMLGAAIFALLGQVAELSGNFFPTTFIVGAVISTISAYSCIKLSNAYPTSGGIAMFLKKEYGKSTFTMALIKVGGILLLAIGGLWSTGFKSENTIPNAIPDKSLVSLIGALGTSSKFTRKD